MLRVLWEDAIPIEELEKRDDRYWLEECKKVAQNSRCLSRKIGAIIVDPFGWKISEGFNGPPERVIRCGMKRYMQDKALSDEINNKKLNDPNVFQEIGKVCPRYILGYKSGKGLHLCPAVHAERDALLKALRQQSDVDGATIYMDCRVPCGPCMVELLQANIAEIVCAEIVFYDELSRYLVHNSDIKLRTYDLGEE